MAVSTGYNLPPAPSKPGGSFAISGNKIVTPDTLNRTFAYGQQGQIEMKPIDQVAQSTLAPGQQPQNQEELDILSSDPVDLIKRQHDQELQQLENSLLTAKDEITKKTRYKIAELEQERGLKINQLQRKYNRSLKEGETKQDLQREFQQALADLNDQVDLAKLRISSKVQPDVDMLDMQGQQAITAARQQFQNKIRDLDLIDSLVEDGTIVDPAVARQKKLQIAGYSLPITGLREQKINWDTEQSRVSAIVRQLEKFLSPENLTGTFNVETGQFVKPSDEEITNATNLLQAYKVYYNEMIMPNLFPQYREVYKRASKLGSAAEYARTGKVVPATGRPIGTIGTEITKVKEQMTPNQSKSIADPLGLR